MLYLCLLTLRLLQSQLENESKVHFKTAFGANVSLISCLANKTTAVKLMRANNQRKTISKQKKYWELLLLLDNESATTALLLHAYWDRIFMDMFTSYLLQSLTYQTQVCLFLAVCEKDVTR